MSGLETIITKLNDYLRKKGLPKIEGKLEDLDDCDELYEAALRSVWKLKDKEQRETIAIEIAKGLKKYFGGKNLEEAYHELSVKLNQEEMQDKVKQEKKEKQERLKDPNYVPSFIVAILSLVGLLMSFLILK